MRMICLLCATLLSAAVTAPAQAQYTIEKLIADLQSLPDQQLPITEDVLVVTPNGTLIFNEDFAADRPANYEKMLAVTAYCGGSGRPVLLKQASGSFEYRWCKDGTGFAALDIYQYVGGSAYLTNSIKVSCSGSASGIPAVVRAQSC